MISLQQLTPLLFLLMLLVTLVVWVSSIAAIIKYARYYKFDVEKDLIIFPLYIWVFCGVFGGPITAAIFWLLHHSTLNPKIKRTS